MNDNLSTNDFGDLSKRLDALIYLMLNKVDGQPMLLKDQVRLLDNLSFRPVEIAAILGKTQTHISKELASVRKTNGKRLSGSKKSGRKKK